MSEPTPQDVFPIWAVIALSVGLPWVIGQVWHLRAVFASADKAVTRYPARPLIRFAAILILALGLVLIWFGIDRVLDDDAVIAVAALAFGVLLEAIALTAANQTEVILDKSGVRSRQVFGRNRAIAWDDLSHVEITMNASTLGGTTHYLRGSDGRTISATDFAFNTPDLLGRIRQRRSLPERPYNRRRWYGG